MKLIESPQVFLLGKPQVYIPGMLAYLRKVGGEAWWDRAGSKIALQEIPDAEGLIEFMGRLCYRSWEPGLNANVTKIREDRNDYLLNILVQAHGSVLEHATFNFAISDIARFVYDELVRHRVGVAISAQSGRYVRMGEIPFRIPPFLKPETQKIMRKLVEEIEISYAEMVKREGIDEMESFADKKRATSALRRVAPHGMAWETGWSANVRTIRHVIEMCTAAGAEEEIRIFGHQLGEIMRVECPALFGDYALANTVMDSVPEWVTEFRKV